jgi:hypothetical protein
MALCAIPFLKDIGGSPYEFFKAKILDSASVLIVGAARLGCIYVWADSADVYGVSIFFYKLERYDTRNAVCWT